MESTYLQVRTNSADKEQASAILDELGTNLSTVVNMLLKQIIITRGIPFDINLSPRSTKKVYISEMNTAETATEGISQNN